MFSLLALDTNEAPDALAMAKGETRALNYRLLENGLPKSVTGLTFKFAAKSHVEDEAYKIEPVTATPIEGQTGEFSFTVSPAAIFNGLYEIAMYDATPHKTVLTRPGGLVCRVHEDIID